MTQVKIIGDKNYLKRSTVTGSYDMTAPSTLVGGFYRSSYTYTHSLGYIPMVRVYYDPLDTGNIYPATGDRTTVTGIGLGSNDIMLSWELTTTAITFYFDAGSTKTGERMIYWVIYKDIAV